MQSNARQRSCVRSPAIKKAQGAKGGGEGEESRQRMRRGRRRRRAAAEEASVFPQERGCRAKSTWKSRGMGKWCCTAPEPSSQNLHSVLLDSALLSSVVISRVRVDAISSGLQTGSSALMRRTQSTSSFKTR